MLKKKLGNKQRVLWYFLKWRIDVVIIIISIIIIIIIIIIIMSFI